MATEQNQGVPCWYELSTTDLQGAQSFYGTVADWTFMDAGMEGMTYVLASAGDGATVAGFSDLAEMGSDGVPPNWLCYFGADDIDATVRQITDKGGRVIAEPADIPGTGRFAICTDPQGAAFGLLQPLPMEPDSQGGRAWDQHAMGHGNWHELMTSDPVAALAFYGEVLGWTPGEAMDMGEMGTYQILQRGEAMIGAIMALGDAPVPAWLPYFGLPSTPSAIEAVQDNGGTVHHGPQDVPGGAEIAICVDPQGAWFAFIGPKADQA